MLFANDFNGNRIKAHSKGDRALCPVCGSKVLAKVGSVKIAHWSHKNLSECDSWSEPISQWHLDWQNNFPSEFQEVTLSSGENGIKHRADVLLPNGLVIEIQNSPIQIEDVQAREEFYGSRGGMAWVLNGEKLASRSILKYSLTHARNTIEIWYPSFLEDFPDYDMDVIQDKFKSTSVFRSLYNNPAVSDVKTRRGYWIEICFNDFVPRHSLHSELKRELESKFYEILGRHIPLNEKEIGSRYDFIPEDRFDSIELEKRYWRRFIDSMRYPVYIDGLLSDKRFIYSLKSNSIVSKDLLLRFFSNNPMPSMFKR